SRGSKSAQSAASIACPWREHPIPPEDPVPNSTVFPWTESQRPADRSPALAASFPSRAPSAKPHSNALPVPPPPTAAPDRRLRIVARPAGLHSEPAPVPSRPRDGVLPLAASSARPPAAPPPPRCHRRLRAPPGLRPCRVANPRRKYTNPHHDSVV